MNELQNMSIIIGLPLISLKRHIQTLKLSLLRIEELNDESSKIALTPVITNSLTIANEAYSAVEKRVALMANHIANQPILMKELMPVFNEPGLCEIEKEAIEVMRLEIEKILKSDPH